MRIAVLLVCWSLCICSWTAEGTFKVVKPLADLPQKIGTIQRIHWFVNEKIHGDIQIVVLKRAHYRMHLVDQSVTFPIGAVTVEQFREQTPGAIVAINGGYFDKQFKAMGLFMLHGQQQQPISAETVLSGIVGLNADGTVSLFRVIAM